MMRTRDGAEFHLGMTLVSTMGGDMHTDPDEFHVEQKDEGGETRYFLGRKGSCVTMDLRYFYSSRRAWLEGDIRNLEAFKGTIQAEIDEKRRQLETMGREGGPM